MTKLFYESCLLARKTSPLLTKKENELIASRSQKAAERVKNKRKLAIINWEIKILNSMTSFIDATSSHTKDDADEITNLRKIETKNHRKILKMRNLLKMEHSFICVLQNPR